ncbi:MAG: hypothetical protein R3352_02535 [Salinisphaeraceae bacterium]|nr:hypothetical protein [Salinisphaeraceae bacterium]
MRKFLFCLALFVAQPAAALHIGPLEGAGWQARDLRMQITLGQAGSQGVIQLAEVALPEPFGSIQNLRLSCQPLIFEAKRIACLDAPVSAQWQFLDKPAARASFEYIAATGEVRLSLKQLSALGGQLSMHYELNAEGWRANGEMQALQAARIAPLLASAGQEISADAGNLSGQIKAWGNEEQLNIDFDTSLTELTAYDAAGELASEKLTLKLSGVAAPYREGWRSRLHLALQSGQLYVNPVFLDLSGQPLDLFTRLHYFPNAVLFDELQLEHKNSLKLEAEGSIELGEKTGLKNLSVNKLSAQLAQAYPVFLQPFLLDSGLGELETLGQIQGDLQMRDGGLQRINLQLQAVTAHDKQQRYSVDELSGAVHWQAEPGQANKAQAQNEQTKQSKLQWAGGTAYKLPFGSGELHWQATDKNLQLLKPLNLPLVGGQLQVNRFSAKGLGSEAMNLQFDGALQGLKLSQLTRALEWPEFAGSLSGRLPDLSYSDGVFTVGGTLAAEVFDGTVKLNGLRVDNPFGRLPKLEADIQMRDLDLAMATSAFQFGAIEGRLHGDVKGLRLVNWQPAAFDAEFYTPPDDKSRHRISQRAIENISSLGGAGAGAALSRGFMQFFENFAYDRLGISCRLANAVCLMGGIEPAPDKGGYYLVKGKLLPRIDVIGYAREVSWPALVEQLRSIAAGEGPVVR